MLFLNPKVLKWGLPALAVLIIIFHLIKKKIKYKGGIKAANTSFVKGLSIYKNKRRFYTFVSCALEICIIGTLVSTMFLIARPAKKESVSNGTKKRDIFLCMDVSYSIYALNEDLVENLEDVVRGLDGDRFGISIYNTSTVLYVPMTDDYDFIISKLEELKEYFKLQSEFMDKYYNETTNTYDYDYDEYDDYLALQEKLDYWDAGTLVNNYIKGSSLVGEGLASCVYSYPRLEDEDRTRVIIMSTDNAQEERETPLVELDEATDICKKYDITVFGLFPMKEKWSGMNTTDYANDKSEFEKCVQKTGGKFYEESKTLTVEDIVKDIEKEEALEVEEITTTKIYDQPAVPVIALLSFLVVILVIGLVIKL